MGKTINMEGGRPLSYEVDGRFIEVHRFNKYLGLLTQMASGLGEILEDTEDGQQPTGFIYQTLDHSSTVERFFKLAGCKKLLPSKVGECRVIPIRFVSSDGQLLKTGPHNTLEGEVFMGKSCIIVQRYEKDYIEKFRLYILAYPQDKSDGELAEITLYLLGLGIGPQG